MNNQQPLSVLQVAEYWSRTPLTPNWTRTDDKLENVIRICVSTAVWGAVAAAAGRYWFAMPLRHGFVLNATHHLGLALLFAGSRGRPGVSRLLVAGGTLAQGLLMKRLGFATSYVEAIGMATAMSLSVHAAMLFVRATLWLAGQEKGLTNQFAFGLVNVS